MAPKTTTATPAPFALLGVQTAAADNGVEVARVRMFLDDQTVDEDFLLPDLPPGVPATVEVYQHFLGSTIDSRTVEIANGVNDPAKSEYVPEQGDQVVMPAMDPPGVDA